MKEIYKIPKGQNVATSEGWKYIDTEIKNFVYETEQVPETFTELIKLCQTLNTDRIRTTKQVIYIKPTSCWLGEIRVNCMGAIMNSDFQDIAYHRSMPQLWSFIKSLIGEE